MSDKMGIYIDWTKLKKIKVTHQDKEFQWKCYHNINYTEQMNLTNGNVISVKLKTTMKWYSIYFLKYYSVRKKSSFNTDNKEKLCSWLLQNFGSHDNNSAFSKFLRKRCSQPHTHFWKWGICPIVVPLLLTPTLPYNIL